MDSVTLDFLTLGISGDESDVIDSSVQDQSFFQPVMQSPPRKRSKVDHSTTSADLSFSEFDSLPVYARGSSKWNSLLAANPIFWISKCESWYQVLQTAFQERNVGYYSVNTFI